MGMVDDIGFTTLIYPLPEKQLEEIDTRVGDKEKADDVGNKADDAWTLRPITMVTMAVYQPYEMMLGDISWEFTMTNLCMYICISIYLYVYR